jgi:Protein of unknown function (DUF2997)
MSQTIEITVSPQGETRIETKGFAGPSCRDATRNLEAALGIRILEQPTVEFHAVTAPEQQPQRQ